MGCGNGLLQHDYLHYPLRAKHWFNGQNFRQGPKLYQAKVVIR